MLQAYTTAINSVNVVNSFANLGYLNPEVAALRCAPEYKFVAPALTGADLVNDVSALEKRIADAKREGATAAKKQVKGTQSMPITASFKKAE